MSFFWSQPANSRPASITAAAVRKRNFIISTPSVHGKSLLFFEQNYNDFVLDF
ncbi:Hypothetical protein EAG7_04174 [Klebsiella aerogenes]|nr:Hypothetical protein EAG7_04174 [Klebsiella aerogenes]